MNDNAASACSPHQIPLPNRVATFVEARFSNRLAFVTQQILVFWILCFMSLCSRVDSNRCRVRDRPSFVLPSCEGPTPSRLRESGASWRHRLLVPSTGYAALSTRYDAPNLIDRRRDPIKGGSSTTAREVRATVARPSAGQTKSPPPPGAGEVVVVAGEGEGTGGCAGDTESRAGSGRPEKRFDSRCSEESRGSLWPVRQRVVSLLNVESLSLSHDLWAAAAAAR